MQKLSSFGRGKKFGLKSHLYTEFIMADGLGKPRYENMKTRRVRIENIFNMATPHAGTISTTVVLTENDISERVLREGNPQN